MENLFCSKRGFVEINHSYSNSDLWIMAERGLLEINTIFENKNNKKIIFTGRSFDVYKEEETNINENIIENLRLKLTHTYSEDENEVVMEINDEWEIFEETNPLDKLKRHLR